MAYVPQRFRYYYDEILNLRPYHVTTFGNYARIFEYGMMFSKNVLKEKGIEHVDLGTYPGFGTGPRYLFYDVKVEEDRVEYRFRNVSESVNLDDYVRFFLFIGRSRSPKYFYMMCEKLLKVKEPIIVLVLKKLRDLTKYFEEKDVEYLIVYGPGAGYGQFFNNIHDFALWAALPSPNPLKCALHYYLENKDVGVQREYYDRILASEFCIKNQCSSDIIYKVCIYVPKKGSEEIKESEEGKELAYIILELLRDSKLHFNVVEDTSEIVKDLWSVIYGRKVHV